ncbi:hypothetical protein GCM10023334_000300 [Nonomuraea thailandensis]
MLVPFVLASAAADGVRDRPMGSERGRGVTAWLRSRTGSFLRGEEPAGCHRRTWNRATFTIAVIHADENGFDLLIPVSRVSGHASSARTKVTGYEIS